MTSRVSVGKGSEYTVYAVFKDAAGEYADVDTDTLSLAVYPPGYLPSESEVGDAWVYGVTLASIGLGPQAENLVVRSAEGRYEYTFTIPSDSILGIAYDKWTGTITGQSLSEVFSIKIVDSGSIGSVQLYNNNIVFIELKSTIASEDGETLGQDYRWHFTTTYDPLYTSVRRVRLSLGPLVKDVPDDTINLAIFEARLVASALVFGSLSPSNWTYFHFARRMYTTCLAEMILLGGIMGSGGGAKTKSLADLTVNYDDNIDDLMNRALGCMAKYEGVLTSSGVLAPGTSHKPDYVVKGIDDPDRPVFARGWEPTSTYAGSEVQMPAANAKSRYNWKRRSQRDFAWPNRWNALWRR